MFYRTPLIQERLRYTDSLVRGAVLILLATPFIIKHSSLRPAWDELYFLHRASCVDRAFFSGSIGEIGSCIRAMSKSPIMASLLIPAGPLIGNAAKLNVASLALALLTFFQVGFLAHLTLRLRIPLSSALLAAIALCLNPHLHMFQGAFLVDMLLAFTVANTLLLTAVEATTRESSDGEATLQGIMWGLQGSLGMLAKLTYGYFGFFLFVPAILLSWKNVGLRRTLIKAIGAVAVGALPAFLIVAYGQGFLYHAVGAAFGDISAFYSDNLSLGRFILSSARDAGLAWLALAIIGIQIIWRGGRDSRRTLTAAYLAIVVVVYFLISSLSVNRDARFFFPVWVALPWCAALAVAPMRKTTDGTQAGGGAMLLQAALVVFLSLPMAARFDLRELNEARAALGILPRDRAVNLILASDEPGFNIETLLLAQEVDYSTLHNIVASTLVYNVTQGLTVDQSIDRLVKADYVILRSPVGPGAPEWANRFYERFLAAARERGTLIRASDSWPQVLVFSMHKP